MNSLKLTFLMASLTVLFVFLGSLIGGQTGMLIAFAVAIAMNFSSYWFSDKIVLRMYDAQEVTQQEHPTLFHMVSGMADKGNLPMPKVYIIDKPAPNAFATGRNPANAAVAVTTGLMNILDENELSGVIGHELAHVQNRDILISSIAATFAGAISMIGNVGRFLPRSGGRRGGMHPLAGIGAMLIAPFAASLIKMAISRSREYLADAGGAKLCGNPQYLADALAKLEYGSKATPLKANEATAHMFIVSPLTGAGGLSALFRTHPVTDERIRRLQEMSRNA